MIVSDSEEETDQNLAKSKENSINSNDDSDTKRYLNVVDVCTTRELFFTFREDLKEQKSFGICLACTPYKKVSLFLNFFIKYQYNILGGSNKKEIQANQGEPGDPCTILLY